MLERGIIAPNALFEELNPDIDAEYLNIKVGLPTFHVMRGSWLCLSNLTLREGSNRIHSLA